MSKSGHDSLSPLIDDVQDLINLQLSSWVVARSIGLHSIEAVASTARSSAELGQNGLQLSVEKINDLGKFALGLLPSLGDRNSN